MKGCFLRFQPPPFMLLCWLIYIEARGTTPSYSCWYSDYGVIGYNFYICWNVFEQNSPLLVLVKNWFHNLNPCSLLFSWSILLLNVNMRVNRIVVDTFVHFKMHFVEGSMNTGTYSRGLMILLKSNNLLIKKYFQEICNDINSVHCRYGDFYGK